MRILRIDIMDLNAGLAIGGSDGCVLRLGAPGVHRGQQLQAVGVIRLPQLLARTVEQHGPEGGPFAVQPAGAPYPANFLAQSGCPGRPTRPAVSRSLEHICGHPSFLGCFPTDASANR